MSDGPRYVAERGEVADEHVVTVSEHGARAGVLYVSCRCGFESGPHRWPGAKAAAEKHQRTGR